MLFWIRLMSGRTNQEQDEQRYEISA